MWQGTFWVKEKFVLDECYSHRDEMKAVAEARQRLSDNENLARQITAEGVKLEHEYGRLIREGERLWAVREEKLKLQADLERQISEHTGEDHDWF